MRVRRKVSGRILGAALAMVLCAGCQSLKPEPQAVLRRDCPPPPESPAAETAWGCVGMVLEILGPWLAYH